MPSSVSGDGLAARTRRTPLGSRSQTSTPRIVAEVSSNSFGLELAEVVRAGPQRSTFVLALAARHGARRARRRAGRTGRAGGAAGGRAAARGRRREARAHGDRGRLRARRSSVPLGAGERRLRIRCSTWWACSPWPSWARSPWRSAGTARRREDLLERERGAREEATRARDELEAMLSGIADAVTGQAPDGSLIYANDAALDDPRVRVARGADGHRRPRRSSPASTSTRSRARRSRSSELPGRRALAGEGGAEAIIRFRVRATGEERWSVVKSTPVRDDDGFLRMAINVIEDITAHKRSELAERFLSESSRLLASSLDPDEVLERVARAGRAGGGGLVRGGRAARGRGARARGARPHRPRDAREGPRGEPPLPAARRPADRARRT